MKILVVTLLIAAAFGGFTKSALHGGSTPARWLLCANYPGLMIAASFFGLLGKSTTYLIVILVNWFFYFWLVEGTLFLWSKIKRDDR